MGIGVHICCDLSMQGPHHARRLYSSHFHAHLPTFEFDEDGLRTQCFLEVVGELLTKTLLQLRLTRNSMK